MKASIEWKTLRPGAIVIGASTGGPAALERLLSVIRPPLNCPIAIVQHLPAAFTASLAERLAKVSGLPVREARHGEPFEAGHVYLAPGDYHMRLVRERSGVHLTLDQEALCNSVRPAVDHLFTSAAEAYRKDCLGVVMTGMGQDGLDGVVAIKKTGGAVLIQSQESCTVWGMPRAVFEAQAFDGQGDPGELGLLLAHMTRGAQ